MFELEGKYGKAKVFASVADDSAIAQVINLLNQPYAEGANVRMMPDIHAGAGCTIGTTMKIKDKVCPNLVGVDIGCGMEVAKLCADIIDLRKLDEIIHNTIPAGRSIRSTPHGMAKNVCLHDLCCAGYIDLNRAHLSIGTLGGGNHFIEVDKDVDGGLYLVVHSGSRHLGMEVANYYQQTAYKALTTHSREEIDAILQALKTQGRQREIQSVLKGLKPKQSPVPKDLAYVEGELFQQYIHDMGIVQQFAMANRHAIIHDIIHTLGVRVDEQFTTVHNYIDMKQLDNMVLRKGAVSAQAGEKLLIPINMRDGSLVCTGKGNEDWNCSAPHGAGRLMSRSEAKEQFSVEEFATEMDGIYTTSVSQSTLDECPMAYKSMEDILGDIGPTVTVDKIIKPVYNFKAGEET